ncbi:hypothetical protein PR048_015156 [Dryococelus australis]|uniref:Uncharacterized protein n=1 Tax=Dryococelus australis TaxID=614101 RepID=A0ABQ9HH56_9NEOP|nr:hypothetical protein PR048_015156 [Dryococelus australis]
MRKTQKSAPYDAFPLCSSSVELRTSYTVVDGCFLLHRFSSICSAGNFLANEKNKTKLIEILVETLTARGIEAGTTTRDADCSIVRCGLIKVTFLSSVVVIGEDDDLLVLLTALTPPDRNVSFMKPGRGNIENKVYSTRQ